MRTHTSPQLVDTRASPNPGTHLLRGREDPAKRFIRFGRKEKKHENAMIGLQEQKRRPETPRHGKRTKEKALDTNGLED